MTCETITHAGSQWRKLCAAHGLDPDQATADDVAQAIRRQALQPVEEALLAFATQLVMSPAACAALHDAVHEQYNTLCHTVWRTPACASAG